MYARITKFKMKPGRMPEAIAKMEEVKAEIMAMPGMKQFINVSNEDGSGYVISLVESKETSDANQQKTQAVWANFSEYLAEPPTPEGYDLNANWTT